MLIDVRTTRTPPRTIMKGGVHGQVIYVVPKPAYVIVFTAGGLDMQKKGRVNLESFD